jgi:protein ImuA
MTFLPSGWPTFDRALGGGWQLGEWHELLGPGFGLGEFTALTPLLAQASERRARVALIHPPYQPYAPALAAAGVDLNQLIVIEPKTSQAACWAAEHCLRALEGGVVVVWTQESQLLDDVVLRRLRRAAQLGRCVGIALRPARAESCPSPAAIRLRYAACEAGLQLTCFKRRVGFALQAQVSAAEETATLHLPALQTVDERTLPMRLTPQVRAVAMVGEA